MKTSRLIILAILGSMPLILRAQDAAPASVDLSSKETPPPQATPSLEQQPPDVPALSQLDEAFKQSSLGKQADEHRLHIEWRRLRNQVANDPAVRAAEAATHTARTDLEKRKRLREYYDVYYKRMSALASTPETKLALEALKSLHTGLTLQPRVRASTDAAPKPEAKLTVANVKPVNRPDEPPSKLTRLESPDVSPTPDVSVGAALNLVQQNSPPPVKPDSDIIVSAQKTGQLSKFLWYLNYAGKTAALQAEGPYTVFAPNDQAFNEAFKASSLTLGFNLFASKTQLADTLWKRLSYSIIKGATTSDQLTTGKMPTLNGASLDVKVVNGQISVNDAHVIKADVRASNGVIHIIDKVLVPPGS